jgi:Outer membrane protein beta-barrel domain
MKKAALLSLILVSFFTTNAQTGFGFKGGVNFSSLGGKDGNRDDTKSQVGFNIGALARFPAGEQIAVQTELLFSGKGYRIKELGGDYKSRFSYLSLPVLLRYTFLSGFYTEAGPSLSFLLKAERETGVVGYVNVKDAYRTAAFSWCAGIGYQLKNGLGIGARYNTGLGSISSNNNLNIKFNVFRFGLEWTLRKNEKK